MEKKQNILVLINTFNGGYQSFKIFYDEIIKGINTLGHEPIIMLLMLIGYAKTTRLVFRLTLENMIIILTISHCMMYMD